MAHRLAAGVVGLVALAGIACAPPAPPSGYVPCAIERPALGQARLPAHLVGLPATIDELFPLRLFAPGAYPALPSSDIAVRVRLELSPDGRVIDLCLLDPLEPAIARAFIGWARRSARVRPAFPPSDRRRRWIEERVVWLRRAKPLAEIQANRPLSGLTVEALEAAVARPQTDGPLVGRRAALAELGRIGSRESLAAYDRIEAQAESARPTPQIPDGRSETVIAPDGTAVRLVTDRFGLRSLMRSISPGLPGSWSRPVPLGETNPCCDELRAVVYRGDGLELTCTSCTDDGRLTTVIVRPDDIFRDSDRDGWTDIEERALGLNPASPDSDGDGLPDGEDRCPTLPVSAADRDDDAQLVLAAFGAVLSEIGRRPALVRAGTAPRVHFRGHRGLVLYDSDALGPAIGGAARLRWEVVNRRESSAVVVFRVSHATQSIVTVYLERHGRTWYVVAEDGLSWRGV